MFLACFKCLTEYVELEKPFEIIDWYNGSPEHAAAGDEIKALYAWWTSGRQKEQDACNDITDGLDYEFGGKNNDPNWVVWLAEDERLLAKDDEMLLRLIKVRRYLWT